MLPKKCRKLPNSKPLGEEAFRQAIANALKEELGTTHRAVKTVMAWTGATERTVKNWFSATNCPSGHHLPSLARHSPKVLECFLDQAGQSRLSLLTDVMAIRNQMAECIRVIDGMSIVGSTP